MQSCTDGDSVRLAGLQALSVAISMCEPSAPVMPQLLGGLLPFVHAQGGGQAHDLAVKCIRQLGHQRIAPGMSTHIMTALFQCCVRTRQRDSHLQGIRHVRRLGQWRWIRHAAAALRVSSGAPTMGEDG